MNPTAAERTVLGDLAKRVAEIAALPEMQARRDAAIALNELRSQRPRIYCFAEGAWLECIPPGTVRCTDPILRSWETRLRMAVYTYEVFQDDQVIDAAFHVPWDMGVTDFGVEVQTEIPDADRRQTYYIHPYVALSLQSNAELGAYHWQPPLRQREDIAKLQPRRVELNEVGSAEWLDTARELFEPVLEVRRRGNPWALVGAVPAPAVQLRGMQELMMDMYDDPEWVHRFVGLLADSHHAVLDELESRDLLTLNNGPEWIGTGGLGYTTQLPAEDFNGRVRLKDVWGGDQGQDLVGISPSMFAEFFLPYIRPIMERYGLSHYGCCEPVHDWIEHLRTIRNLRRISISPWSDVRRCAEQMGGDFVFSRKPKPTDISTERMDDDAIRRALVDEFRITRANGCQVEVMMKDLHTVQHDPGRIPRWIALAKQARDDVYG